MSIFTADRNKPRVEAFVQVFTTSAVSFFPADDRGLVIIRLVIDNQDPTNSITFTKNGRGGIIYTIPPNSLGIIDNEVLTGVRLVPDGATGTGILTAELAVRADLTRGGFLK